MDNKNIKSFNLVDKPWIPVIDGNRGDAVPCERLVSLSDIFGDEKKGYEIKKLAGTPRQKIAIGKFLLSIGQAAATPKDENAWAEMGAEGMRRKCREYLESEKIKTRFDLYDQEHPFLQMKSFPKEVNVYKNGKNTDKKIPQVKTVDKKLLNIIFPELAIGNNPFLWQFQKKDFFTDAEKAVLLLMAQSMALGDKRTDKSVYFADELAGRSCQSPVAPGPGTGRVGILHTFLTGPSLLETVWLNLLDAAFIKKMYWLKQGLGMPAWEKMPETEICARAEELRDSLQGRLLPLSRFCLLDAGDDKTFYIASGIEYLPEMDAWDPSATVGEKRILKKGKGGKKQNWERDVLPALPERKPWRELPALLVSAKNADLKGEKMCAQLKCCLGRLERTKPGYDYGVWSGGLGFTRSGDTRELKNGMQIVSDLCDSVESEVFLKTCAVPAIFLGSMENIELIANLLKKHVALYWEGVKSEAAKDRKNSESGAIASNACHSFWTRLDDMSQSFFEICACDDHGGKIKEKLKNFENRVFGIALGFYDKFCPTGTVRQTRLWAENRFSMKNLSWEKKNGDEKSSLREKKKTEE